MPYEIEGKGLGGEVVSLAQGLQSLSEVQSYLAAIEREFPEYSDLTVYRYSEFPFTKRKKVEVPIGRI
jgi:hypothetical protein